MVRVKICGITNLEDALLAVEQGADALGFIFAESPRRIEPETAKSISEALPPLVNRVGVFVNETLGKVKGIISRCNLDTLQFHGNELPSYCGNFREKVIKSFQIKDGQGLPLLSSYSVDAFLLDTYVDDLPGGTGKTFNWKIAKQANGYGTVILSGGLNPENVAQAIKEAQPYAVDVASGIETEPGKKDPDKLKAFMEAIAGCKL